MSTSTCYKCICPHELPLKGGEIHYWMLTATTHVLRVTLPEQQPISLHKQQYQQRIQTLSNYNTLNSTYNEVTFNEKLAIMRKISTPNIPHSL